MRISDGFVSGARQGALPLLVWAAHFAFSYLFVALGCIAGLDALRWLGLSLITWVLVTVSAAVLAWLAWVVVRSAHELRGAISHHDTMAGVRVAAATLAWLGVFWTTLPIVMLPACSSAG